MRVFEGGDFNRVKLALGEYSRGCVKRAEY